MPSYVNPEKCDGCKALDKTACQYICPNDLMVLNKETDEGLQPGAGDVLGVLQLREDLPARRPSTSAATPTSCPWAPA